MIPSPLIQSTLKCSELTLILLFYKLHKSLYLFLPTRRRCCQCPFIKESNLCLVKIPMLLDFSKPPLVYSRFITLCLSATSPHRFRDFTNSLFQLLLLKKPLLKKLHYPLSLIKKTRYLSFYIQLIYIHIILCMFIE